MPTEVSSSNAVWIFPLASNVDSVANEKLRARLAESLTDWNSHGAPLSAQVEVAADRFVVIATDHGQSEVSGCAKDSLRKSVSAVVAELGLSLAGYSDVFFLSGTEVTKVSRSELAQQFAQKRLSAETTVFDTTVQSWDEYRKHFRRPLKDSWHQALVAAA